MHIDEYEVPAEISRYYKDSLNTLPNQTMVLACASLPEMMRGVNQKKPDVKILRQRVISNLSHSTVAGPVLELLREATLNQRLFSALSSKAIQVGANDWASYFGATAFVGSLLLDEREEIRRFAIKEWPALSEKAPASTDQQSSCLLLQNTFGPLLNTLQPIIQGMAYQAPVVVQPAVAAQQPKLSQEEETKRIEASAPYRRLQRQVNELSAQLTTKTTECDRLLSQKQKYETERKSTQIQLDKFNREWHDKVAQSVSDALRHRLGNWLQPSEELADSGNLRSDVLEKAALVLKKQADCDRRYGTVTRLNAKRAEAIHLKNELSLALNESLKPLPELQSTIASLDTEILAIDHALQRGSIAPDSARLEALSRNLHSARTAQEVWIIQSAIKRDFTAQDWSDLQRKNALELIHRRLLTLYFQHGQHQHVRPEDTLQMPPLEILRKTLIDADACVLLIDGHNLLYQVRPFIHSRFFDTAHGPNSQARAHLIEKLRSLVKHHTKIYCELWFDSSEEDDWVETERLKVCFSGGVGANRADARIIQSFENRSHTKMNQRIFVISDDGELRNKALERNAVAMCPIELWLQFLAAESS